MKYKVSAVGTIAIEPVNGGESEGQRIEKPTAVSDGRSYRGREEGPKKEVSRRKGTEKNCVSNMSTGLDKKFTEKG